MSHSPFKRKSIESLQGNDAAHNGNELSRVLSLRDLTFLGIAAIIGAGSFSSLGDACANGGPGVVILFVICGIACAFTAYCYAEFACRVPVAGSAYTYAYVSFGEMVAWVIGWALIMEYSIGNIYVAFSWSDYLTGFLDKLGFHIPDYFSTSYTEARKLATEFKAGKLLKPTSTQVSILNAWKTAPVFNGLRIIADLPAFTINILITALVYIGVKESRNATNVMVILKLAVVLLVILVGAAYINIDNWTPTNPETQVKSFMPNGFSGVMKSVSGVFFAYIGFDAVSVMAEESKNPKRDLPRGMIYSLLLCTAIYIVLSFVLTGVLPYTDFAGVGDPLAKIFEFNAPWMQVLVSIVAVIAMTSVLLVFQLGQPRIWMSMSRDGLMPPVFQKIHPKYKTPSFATLITGAVVGIPILFTDKDFVLDFTSIGTLFAFVLVCGGVLLLPRRPKDSTGFNMPFLSAKFIFPSIVVLAFFLVITFAPSYAENLLIWSGDDGFNHLSQFIFFMLLLPLSIIAFQKDWSLIPLLGLVSCLYLLTGMEKSNWFWFFIWFAIGLVIYAFYGYRKSTLRQKG